MANIETCLNCLNDIDEQTLYAEGMVLSSHIMWSDKVSMVLEALQSTADTEDCEEFIQEAKSVGTGITVSKGDSLLKRVWDFIRRLVRSIINKISDVLTKLKIRNYEYIEIPMDKSLVEKDLDTIGDIYDKTVLTVLENMIKFNEGNDNARTDMRVIDELIKRVSGLNILKGIDDGKRHGVKPNEFMTLRDKIRYIDKNAREILKRTDVYAKKLESKNDKDNSKGNELEYVKRIQKLMTDVSNATTKLFASFKFGSINKTRKMDKEIDVKIKNLKKHVDELSDLINDDKKKNVNESYYDSEYIGIEDLEYIDETEKPYEAYLKKHDYDPKTNTIKIDGERVNAGKMSSKKEINRINKFLRENNYDPKTETIETDIKNDDGSYKRIKFNLSHNNDNNHAIHKTRGDKHVPDSEEITLTQKTTRQKPHKSNQTLKHEEGHINQYNGGSTGADSEIHYTMWENPVNKENDHYKSEELDADLYGLRHNRYASKSKDHDGNRTGLNVRKKDDEVNRNINNIVKDKQNEIEKTKSSSDDISKRNVYVAKNQLRSELKSRMNKLAIIHDDIEEVKRYIEIYKSKGLNDEDSLKEAENEIKMLEKSKVRCNEMIDLINNKLKSIDQNNYDIYIDKSDSMTLREKIDNDIKRVIEDLKTDIEYYENLRTGHRQETDVRNKFLDSHSDEAASQAHKLEGRQGKHKGKK